MATWSDEKQNWHAVLILVWRRIPGEGLVTASETRRARVAPCLFLSWPAPSHRFCSPHQWFPFAKCRGQFSVLLWPCLSATWDAGDCSLRPRRFSSHLWGPCPLLGLLPFLFSWGSFYHFWFSAWDFRVNFICILPSGEQISSSFKSLSVPTEKSASWVPTMLSPKRQLPILAVSAWLVGWRPSTCPCPSFLLFSPPRWDLYALYHMGPPFVFRQQEEGGGWGQSI